jgi:hypothetical protein
MGGDEIEDQEVVRLRRELAEAEAAADAKAKAETRRQAVQDEVEQLKQRISDLKNQGAGDEGVTLSSRPTEPKTPNAPSSAMPNAPSAEAAKSSASPTSVSPKAPATGELQKVKTQRIALGAILLLAVVVVIAILGQNSSSDDSGSTRSAKSDSSPQSSATIYSRRERIANMEDASDPSDAKVYAVPSRGMTSGELSSAYNACPSSMYANCSLLVGRASDRFFYENGDCSYSVVKNWVNQKLWEDPEWPIIVDSAC